MNKEKETITQRKSNKSVKTAVLLFGAVLLTTSLLGGTLAKYVGTIGEASDTARVAKWTVDEEIKAFNLFADSYVETTNVPGEWGNPNSTNTVQGEEENTKVIAPGTKGSALIEIDQSKIADSEVAYKYNFTVNTKDMDKKDPDLEVIPFYRNGDTMVHTNNNGDNATSNEGWNVKENEVTGLFDYWLPLKFRVTQTGNPTPLYDGFKDGANELDDGYKQVRGLRNALVSVESDTIYPQMVSADKVTAISNSSVTVEWEWAFNQGFDNADTQLGKNANLTGEMVPNFVIEIAATKTQVD